MTDTETRSPLPTGMTAETLLAHFEACAVAPPLEPAMHAQMVASLHRDLIDLRLKYLRLDEYAEMLTQEASDVS